MIVHSCPQCGNTAPVRITVCRCGYREVYYEAFPRLLELLPNLRVRSCRRNDFNAMVHRRISNLRLAQILNSKSYPLETIAEAIGKIRDQR